MRKKTIYSRDYAILLRMLREARERVGMNQSDLAKRLAITQSALSKCERGERRLDMVQVRDWCRALRVSFAKFAAEFDSHA